MTTPHQKVDTKKVSKISNNKHIFVYLRRSTTNKQDLSLQRQEDDAEDTIKKNGYKEKDVEYYIESKTAFNGVKENDGKLTRRRSEFTRMLADIDKSPIPVTILTYEPSRLSRNDKDAGEITDRLFGEYNPKKKNIEKILFNNRDIWTQESDKGSVKQILLDAYKESLRIGSRSYRATLRELRRGRFILSTPRGIDRLKAGEDELRVNHEMPYILKAWEMKAEGKDKIEITKYLKKYNIHIGDTFEQYFRKTIYFGYYPDPETGELIKMRFFGGKAPMKVELWNKVQETLGGRRISKYGAKQEDDIIARLLKWIDDRNKAFTVEYPKKGMYRSYKSNAFGGFNRSERKVLTEIKDFLGKRLGVVFEKKFGEKVGAIENRVEEIHLFIGEQYISKLREKYNLSYYINDDKYLGRIGEAQLINWLTGTFYSEGFYCFPLSRKWEDLSNRKDEKMEVLFNQFNQILDEEIQISKQIDDDISLEQTLEKNIKKRVLLLHSRIYKK